MEPWDAAAAARHALAWPIRPFARRFAVCSDWPSIQELNERLADRIGGHVTFVPSAPRRRHRRRSPVGSGDLYDGRIVLHGEVPSRARSWHDFFNALAWAAWPRAKRAFHERQHEAIAARVRSPTLRLPAERTPVQDRLAMLDEGGVVFLVDPAAALELGGALARGDEATVRRVLEAGRAELLVFGHALFDHLRAPAASLFVRPELVVAPGGLAADRPARLAVADAALARALAEHRAPAPGPVVACDLARVACAPAMHPR